MSLWTSDGYIVGFQRQPGANAGYRAGRCLGQGGVVHYTVGRNSAPIGLRGYFTFLLPKNGPGIQFAPWDATCYHACEWNSRLIGVETEKLNDSEPTTDDQILNWARIVSGLREKGIDPPGYYDGARIPVGGQLPARYISHRALVHRACDQHTDYLPQSDMDRVFALAGGSLQGKDDDDMGFLAKINYDDRVWYCRAGVRTQVNSTPGILEIIDQLARAGAVPNPAKVELIGPETLKLYRVQPSDASV